MRGDSDPKSDILMDLNDNSLDFLGDVVVAEDPREPAAHAV